MKIFRAAVNRLVALLVAVSIFEATEAFAVNSSNIFSTDLADPVLRVTGVPPGQAIKPGTKLRILGVGDSISVGFLSGDGNGYRLELKNDLSSEASDLFPDSIN
jgi:hypothetical protein